MKAVILCGGRGTRIRDASELLPKPMLPIGGRPVVWHIMRSYAAHGVNNFVLCLGYKGWALKEFFLNYRAMSSDISVHLGAKPTVEVHGRPDGDDWNVTLAETGEDTMTGGRVAAVKKYVENEELFCVTYGDGVADIDITKLIAFHKAHGKVATITAVRPPGRFGELGIDGDSVRGFNEKPQTTEGFINGGFMVFDAKRIWKYLGDNPATTLEQEPMRQLVADGELRAFRHGGFWQPMDTLRELEMLNDLWARNKAPWKV